MVETTRHIYGRTSCHAKARERFPLITIISPQNNVKEIVIFRHGEIKLFHSGGLVSSWRNNNRVPKKASCNIA